MQKQNRERGLEENICIHIFSVSAGMVGVCLTVIGLLRVVITLQKADTFADDLLAFDAIIFLIACVTSYWALRTPGRMYRLERIADFVFLFGLVIMVGICAFITYAIASFG
jgi:hypothetical protein